MTMEGRKVKTVDPSSLKPMIEGINRWKCRQAFSTSQIWTV